MASFMFLTRDIGKFDRPDERDVKQKKWVSDRLASGRRVSKVLPVRAELNWSDASQPPIPCIIPENAISRKGFVNVIWVPSYTREIHLHDRFYIGVHQEHPIGYGVTLIYIWNDPRRDILLLSPKKLTIIPFLSEG